VRFGEPTPFLPKIVPLTNKKKLLKAVKKHLFVVDFSARLPSCFAYILQSLTYFRKQIPVISITLQQSIFGKIIGLSFVIKAL
jgi:hypothetical protein